MVVDFRLLRGVRVNGSATNGSGSSNSSSVYHTLLEKRGCTVNVDELQSENGANNGERNKSSSSNDNRREEKSRTSDINNAVKKKLKGFSFSSVLLDALYLAKEQMESHSKSYKNLLYKSIHEIVIEWCGKVSDTRISPPFIASLPQSPCLHRIYFYLSHEEYDLDSSKFHKAEADERIDKLLIRPLKDPRLLMQVWNGKCDEGATIAIIQELSCGVVLLILETNLKQKKQFSDRESLLLSKQIQMLERMLTEIRAVKITRRKRRIATESELELVMQH